MVEPPQDQGHMYTDIHMVWQNHLPQLSKLFIIHNSLLFVKRHSYDCEEYEHITPKELIPFNTIPLNPLPLIHNIKDVHLKGSYIL